MAGDVTGAVLDSVSPTEESVETTLEPTAQPNVSEDVQTQGGNDKQTPFNENPRFQELIAEKNAANEERDALKQQIADLQGQQSPEPQKADSDMTPEGEKFLQIAEDRVMAKLQNLVAEQQKQADSQAKQAAQIETDLRSEMGDKFDSFIDFAKKTKADFPSASINELKSAWQRAGSEGVSKVTQPSGTTQPVTKVQSIDPREDMVSAARRAQQESGT